MDDIIIKDGEIVTLNDGKQYYVIWGEDDKRYGISIEEVNTSLKDFKAKQMGKLFGSKS